MDQKKTRSDQSGNDVIGEDNDVTARHLVESGWSWAVDAGVMSSLILFMGVYRSYGLFFVEMQDKYGVSASAMSLIGGAFSATFSLGAMIVLTFALNVLSERQCVLIGVGLMTSSFSVSSLVTSFPVLVVTMGVLVGVAAAMIYGPSFVLLAKYFDRHLTLAQAIANTGVSAGGMLMPFVVRAVLDRYSFPAGLLLIGGILSHMFIAAALFRPVQARKTEGKETAEKNESQRTRGRVFSVEQKSEDRFEDGAEATELDPCLPLAGLQSKRPWAEESRDSAHALCSQRGCASLSQSGDASHCQSGNASRCQSGDASYSQTGNASHSQSGDASLSQSGDASLSQSGDASHSQRGDASHCQSGDASHSQSGDASYSQSGDASHSQSGDASLSQSGDASFSQSSASGCCSDSKPPLCGTDICRNIVMWALVLWQAFGLLTGVLGPAFLPPVAKEKGLSDNEAAFLLTLIGGLDIASRLIPGVIAHYKMMKPHQMVILSLTLQGLLCQFLAFFNSFEAMLGFCVGFGSLSGIFFTMTHATIIEFVGLEGFRLTFGFIQLFNGASAAVGYPIVGALKDITGSYVTSFHFLGATELVAASILVSLPSLYRLQKKLEGKGDKQEEKIAELGEVIPLKV